MAVYGTFRRADALYGSGAAGRGAVDTEGADWVSHGHPGGRVVDTEGADFISHGTGQTVYSTAQDSDSPLARWRFEQPFGAGSFIEDENGVNATPSGTLQAGYPSPSPTKAAYGKGLNLTGVGFAGVAGVSSWTHPLTVETLFTLTATPSGSTRPAIFTQAYSSGQTIPLVLGFNIDGSHSGLLGVGYLSGGTWYAVHMSTGLTLNVPHHIVGVYNGTTGLTLYVDGTSVASGTVTAYSAGTINSTAYIGSRWDTPEEISGVIWDLALYNTALSSTRVTAHYNASIAVTGVTISGGGKPTQPNGHRAGLIHISGGGKPTAPNGHRIVWNIAISGGGKPTAPSGHWSVRQISIHGGGKPTAPNGHWDTAQNEGITISGGGRPKFATFSQLLVPGDGTTWTSYGDLSSVPGSVSGQVQTWKYTANASGTLAVDNSGTSWNTVLTVYASDRTTVLATSSGTTGTPASVSVSVTAGQTYYVAVSPGTGAGTAGPGSYLINAVGPRSSDAPQNQFPAPAAPAIPSASPPPAGLTVVPLNRVSATYPAPTVVNGRPVNWTASSVAVSTWGNFRVVVNGTDVTYFRGYPVQIDSYELGEPFGCHSAQITFPGITPHDAVGTGDTAWLIGGYAVDIVGPNSTLWSGCVGVQVGEYDEQQSTYRISCVGDMWVNDLVIHQPRAYLPPVDIGSLLPAELNLVPHRRVNGITQITTGIKTAQRGSSSDSVISYVQQLLATAGTAGGGQWTIGRVAGSPRTYSMRLKDTTTVSWTVRTGQPGVHAQLQLDSTTATNRVFGRGVRTDGYAWAGWVYPVTGVAAAPSYPFSSPSTTMTIGTTDASTSSGNGVTELQTRINETGIASVTVNGTYSAADATAVKQVQTKLGLTIDGIVGPQTWAAAFDVGNNGTDLNAAYRAPLYALPGATTTLTNADGSTGGTNPANEPNLIIVDRDEDFGDGVSKAQGIASATNEVTRMGTPGWAGQIVLQADPQEMSRWDITEGSNGTLLGWAGRDVTLHVSGVSAVPPSSSDPIGTVTLTVDEHARDLITLGQILRRNLDCTNPAMLPPTGAQRRSASRMDGIVEYDGESSGGIIPKHALYGGLWTVIRIPVSQAGKVAEVQAATVPATPFVLAFFGAAVTPADLITLVGANPLLERGDGYGPFDWNADNLVAHGFIEALGGPGQACGYSPGYQTSPHTGGPTTLTGILNSTGSWTYESSMPPWIWLAEYATASTTISGRIFPAKLDS